MGKYNEQPELVLGDTFEAEIKVPEIQISFNRSTSKELTGKITSSYDASELIRKIYKKGEIELQEQFIVLYLDQANQIIGYYRHSKGGINSTVADTRIILSTALKCTAISMILSHNHPSGNLKPSDADITLTRKLKDAAKQMDLSVLDHLIVTKSGYYSFADDGLLGLPGMLNEEKQDAIDGIVKFKPEVTFNSSRISKSGKKAPDGIEIRFGDTKPTEEVRAMLKKHGFRFSEKQKMWYALDKTETRKFAEEILDSELDVDDTKYEKLVFWTRVKNFHEYQRFYDFTNFMVKGDPSLYFNSKKKLESANPNIGDLISEGRLLFKKFYNKAIDEHAPNLPDSGSKDDWEKDQGEHDLELLELEAQAELELLKMEMESKKAPSLSGTDQDRLKYLERKAWERQAKWDVLNFK